jgi:hypothetical protein
MRLPIDTSRLQFLVVAGAEPLRVLRRGSRGRRGRRGRTRTGRSCGGAAPETTGNSCPHACAGSAARSPRPGSPTAAGDTRCGACPGPQARPRRAPRRPPPRSPPPSNAATRGSAISTSPATPGRQHDRLAHEILKPPIANLRDIGSRHPLTLDHRGVSFPSDFVVKPTSLSTTVVRTTTWGSLHHFYATTDAVPAMTRRRRIPTFAITPNQTATIAVSTAGAAAACRRGRSRC